METFETLKVSRGPYGKPVKVAYKVIEKSENKIIRFVYALYKDGTIRGRQDHKSYYDFENGKWHTVKAFKEGTTFDTLDAKGYTYLVPEVKEEVQYESLSEKIKAETKARKERYSKFKKVWQEAIRLGLAAGNAHNPTPMHVYTPKYPFGMGGPESIPDTTKPQYVVNSGVCGFAWLSIFPGNSSFARWLVKNTKADSAYGGGVSYWISEFGQSMERKEKMAAAMAQYLNENLDEPNVTIYPQSRMD